jgi:hypothetical protein
VALGFRFRQILQIQEPKRFTSPQPATFVNLSWHSLRLLELPIIALRRRANLLLLLHAACPNPAAQTLIYPSIESMAMPRDE